MLAWLRAMLRLPPPTGRALGRAGERLAAGHLRRQGYRVLERNSVVRPGEADIVCLAPDRRTIVIVEVKTRLSDPSRGGPAYPPEVNIDARKRRKLLQVARALMARRRWAGRPCRIDVVAVEWSARGRHVIRHHTGAVRG